MSRARESPVIPEPGYHSDASGAARSCVVETRQPQCNNSLFADATAHRTRPTAAAPISRTSIVPRTGRGSLRPSDVLGVAVEASTASSERVLGLPRRGRKKRGHAVAEENSIRKGGPPSTRTQQRRSPGQRVGGRRLSPARTTAESSSEAVPRSRTTAAERFRKNFFGFLALFFRPVVLVVFLIWRLGFGLRILQPITIHGIAPWEGAFHFVTAHSDIRRSTR